ncbi:MAG TPA: hypothetical protein VLA05_04830 [Coriobacteriia bacterium]|nr:hypothetical protein [Coriobacteriia bacterium]
MARVEVAALALASLGVLGVIESRHLKGHGVVARDAPARRDGGTVIQRKGGSAFDVRPNLTEGHDLM